MHKIHTLYSGIFQHPQSVASTPTDPKRLCLLESAGRLRRVFESNLTAVEMKDIFLFKDKTKIINETILIQRLYLKLYFIFNGLYKIEQIAQDGLHATTRRGEEISIGQMVQMASGQVSTCILYCGICSHTFDQNSPHGILVP